MKFSIVTPSDDGEEIKSMKTKRENRTMISEFSSSVFLNNL